MGNGLQPGPIGASSFDVDEGTMPRVGTPPPGPVGLDAKNEPTKAPPGPSLGQRILVFASGKLNTVHGNGECFTLADDALKGSGAKSAADFGRVAPDVDYVWGTAVTRANLQPGDVLQMKNYRVDIEETIAKSDGSAEINDIFEERPHHTAILESVGADGRVTVLEQNHPVGTAVTRNVLHLTNATYSSGNKSYKVKVKGTFWYYRPQAR
ncbi:MAG TPA: hypothetical protein VMF13_04375 [Luteitalea sp.]|nr:hypothetical protein [Luteitalea sp.]